MAGKSNWHQQILPEALRLDLLDTSLFLELSRDLHLIEDMIGGRPENNAVVLDKIQKIPALLDEHQPNGKSSKC